MEQTSAAEIVRSVGMNERPECYLGRGIRTEDINGDKLYQIYKIIKNELGVKAANSFGMIVKEIYPLSATNFLEELYRLEKCGWDMHAFRANITGYIKGRFVKMFEDEIWPRERYLVHEEDVER